MTTRLEKPPGPHPWCDRCRRPVQMFTVSMDFSRDAIEYIASCHGETDSAKISQQDLEERRFGDILMFKTPPEAKPQHTDPDQSVEEKASE